MKLLIKHGADINYFDKQGYSSLFLAIHSQDIFCLLYILSLDPNLEVSGVQFLSDLVDDGFGKQINSDISTSNEQVPAGNEGSEAKALEEEGLVPSLLDDKIVGNNLTDNGIELFIEDSVYNRDRCGHKPTYVSGINSDILQQLARQPTS